MATSRNDLLTLDQMSPGNVKGLPVLPTASSAAVSSLFRFIGQAAKKADISLRSFMENKPGLKGECTLGSHSNGGK